MLEKTGAEFARGAAGPAGGGIEVDAGVSGGYEPIEGGACRGQGLLPQEARLPRVAGRDRD